MPEIQKWPILHMLVGIPIVLAIAFLASAAIQEWTLSKATLLHGATLTTPVVMAYTFLVTLVERSYFMVFWAREKSRQLFQQARAEAEAQGVARGEALGRARSHAEWQAWYDRMQAALQAGNPFDEPPPDSRKTEMKMDANL